MKKFTFQNMAELLARLRGRIFTLRCKLLHKNITIGTGLKLKKKLDIRGPGKVSIGSDCLIDGIRGDNHRFVTLYTHSPTARIAIGDNTRLYAARISSRFSIVIGKDVIVEDSSIMDTDFHSIGRERKAPIAEFTENCSIVLDDRVAIGNRSVVGKGTRIGHDTVIGPGSIVTHSIPEMCFALGNPARVVSQYPPALCANESEALDPLKNSSGRIGVLSMKTTKTTLAHGTPETKSYG